MFVPLEIKDGHEQADRQESQLDQLLFPRSILEKVGRHQFQDFSLPTLIYQNCLQSCTFPMTLGTFSTALLTARKVRFLWMRKRASFAKYDFYCEEHIKNFKPNNHKCSTRGRSKNVLRVLEKSLRQGTNWSPRCHSNRTTFTFATQNVTGRLVGRLVFWRNYTKFLPHLH